MIRLFLSSLALLFLALPAQAADSAATTHHDGTFNGHAIGYSATVALTGVAGADGAAAASLGSISYVKDGHDAGRPVIFFFNGGPGASSSPLHMALGPRHIVGGEAGQHLVDNPDSPLDCADLVFIDPVGTGFARPLPGKDGAAFWRVSADAAAVSHFIADWLKSHQREASPVFIAGESYGTNRAAQIVATHSGYTIRGVLLISLYADPQDADLQSMTLLPSLASVAAFHGHNALTKDPQGAFDEAVEFSRTVYLPALVEGSAIPAAEKQKIATEVAKRIGLTPELIAQKDLRLDPYDQMLNMLKGQGLRTGQSDARIIGKIADYADKKPPFDDPSMFSLKPGSSTKDIVQAYLTGELGFKTTESYTTLNMEVNSKWQYDVDDAIKMPAALIGTAMKKDKALRLFWAGGLFDLRTPLYGGIYALRHAGIPANRLTILTQPSGHGVYEGDENLKGFTRAVRQFVTQK